MLSFGHGVDPTEGLTEGEPLKVANMAAVMARLSKLEQSGESARVSLVCAQHNQLAPDTGRGKAARKWLAVLGDPEDDDHEEEQKTRALREAGLGPLAIYVGRLKMKRGCQAANCPYQDLDSDFGRLTRMAPSYDCGSDVEEDENPFKVSGPEVYGIEGRGEQGKEAKVQGRGDQGDDDDDDDDDHLDLDEQLWYDAVVVEERMQACTDNKGQEEAAGKCGVGSYRPTRASLASKGVDLPLDSQCFFGSTSTRVGYVRNTSALVSAGDTLLARTNNKAQYDKLLGVLKKELQRMVETRQVMHAACHRATDAKRYVHFPPWPAISRPAQLV